MHPTKTIENVDIVPYLFVMATKDIVTSENDLIEQSDVGVMTSEGKDHALIFFVRIWKHVELTKGDFDAIDVAKIGDSFSKKICNVCHKLKDTSQFQKNQNAKDNRSVRRPSCQSCRQKIDGTNISPSERLEWIKQKPINVPFECPICSKRTIAGITSKVVLEHDHRTGKVGGWICDSCNTGLGRFKDDIQILERAKEFLKKNY